jgi:hypothetical protein
MCFSQAVDEESSGWDDEHNNITLVYMDMATKDSTEKVREIQSVEGEAQPIQLGLIENDTVSPAGNRGRDLLVEIQRSQPDPTADNVHSTVLESDVRSEF